MKINKRLTVPFRRKREQRTNYRKRIALLKSNIARLVIRKTLNGVIVQLVTYDPKGDKVLVTVQSKSLEKFGWPTKGNTPSAYLTGYLLAKKSPVKKAIVDIGLHTPVRGSRLFAVVKGAVDGGLDVVHSQEALPSDERISGAHIANYAKSLASDKKNYQAKFSKYLKNKVNPETLPELFEKTKAKIEQEKTK
ncbi:50S ribosomal protein L18 [Candidatus Woesearchaeota archaeon]|nr:50S ribosomal protein L18 [Candidatus Woesearchaeota archaeon]